MSERKEFNIWVELQTRYRTGKEAGGRWGAIRYDPLDLRKRELQRAVKEDRKRARLFKRVMDQALEDAIEEVLRMNRR